jgi:two-component system, NtrC family, response regulator HydG
MNANAMDLATIKYAVPARKILSFRLTVVDGSMKGHVFDVPSDGARALIGTAPTCTLVVTDPHASRRHFSAIATESHLDIYDLGSSNGTIVNGVRVSECACVGGELIRVGETTLRVDADLAHSSTPQDAHPATNFGAAIGNSFSMRQVFAACARAAASDAPLTIEGERGTGKEMLAECIHRASRRAQAPFVVFDPAMAPEHTLVHMLFGVAPLGNDPGAAGLLEQADGGTLIIDGPSSLSLDLQRRLLRVLERGEIQRTGAQTVSKTNVRFIVLSDVDLEKAVEDGLLREDLLSLLSAVRIEIPPLRKRREDIAPLVALFWNMFGGAEIPAGLVARFEAQAWPGNAGELQATVARYLATGELAKANVAEVREGAATTSFGAVFEQIMSMNLPLPQAKQRASAEFESEYVRRVLAKHGGNVSRAAAASGIAHRYFQIINARHRKV